jgi:hypothetical protein
MKRLHAALAVAAVAMSGGAALIAPAHAVPPTVTPSPGYDARLQEQRTPATVVYEPVRPVSRRHPKRTPAH